MTRTDLEEFRSEKDHVFAHDPRSPLSPAQRRTFDGLAYYPENPALVITAKVERSADAKTVRILTTKGREQVYHAYGVVEFSLEGRPARLTLYASDGSPSLFVPFRDATSRDETYGGGRYLEVDPHGDDEVILDFNYAYNPYCAYSSQWECPVPPAENWLSLPIRAGEKRFPGVEEQ